jgi:hypothetical protein
MATASPGSWASRGVAAPGAILGERPGGCREQLTRALPADAAPEPGAPATSITGAQRRAGLDAWLGGLARDTGIFSWICRTPRRNIPCNPRCLPAARRQQDRKSQRLPRPPHTTPIRGRLGCCQAPGHPGTCRMCRSGRRPTIRLTEPTSDITEAGGNQEQSPVVLEAFTTARPAEYKSGTAQSGARAARLRARSGVSWLVRSLREAVMSAQPLLGVSAGTRGRPSQPPVPHEDFVHPCGAVPAPSAPDR